MQASKILDSVLSAWYALNCKVALQFALQSEEEKDENKRHGALRAVRSPACRLRVGAVGAPVFAGFKGGIGALLGVTGGYLVSYLFMGLVVILAEKWFGRSNLVFLIAGVIALVVCYAFGTAWFVVAYAKTAGPISWAAALGKCVLPVVIPELIKLALAALLRARVGKYLPAAA